MAHWLHSLAAAALFLGACDIRHAPSPINLDGELDEPIWKGALRTGPFVNEVGQPAAPYSDARFVVGREFVFLGLYAADEDIRSDDVFEVELGGRTLRYSPADRGPDVGVDMDGTLNDASDLDEEWVVEARVPRAGLPHGDVPVHVRRCDTPKDGVRRCGETRITLRLP
jgi:hypothetical protein